MTGNEYQREALRTEGVVLPFDMSSTDMNRLLQGLMGLNGEAGEAIDILKKHLFQGHAFDREHLMKELGDVAWYLAVSADALGFTLDEVLECNVAKLRKRYPNGFECERSRNRSGKDV